MFFTVCSAEGYAVMNTASEVDRKIEEIKLLFI